MLFNSCLIFDGVVGSAEYALETEVGKQADVSFFYSIHTTKIFFLQKYNFYIKSANKSTEFLQIKIYLLLYSPFQGYVIS